MPRALHHVLGSSRTLLWGPRQVQRQMGSLQFGFHPGLVWGTQEGGRDSFFTPRGRDHGPEAWEGGACSHRNDLAPLCPLPEGRAASGLAGCLQVNEVVFSPSESHCATCGDDGSVRVWSSSSMELVIQFQVLNQVLGAPGAVCELGVGPCLSTDGLWELHPPFGLSVCPRPRGWAPCCSPGEC